MVSVVENWSKIEGRIGSILPGEIHDFFNLVMKIEKISPVSGFPNLVNVKPGEKITIKIKKAEADKLKLKADQKISGLVKVASLNDYHFKQGSIEILA